LHEHFKAEYTIPDVIIACLATKIVGKAMASAEFQHHFCCNVPVLMGKPEEKELHSALDIKMWGTGLTGR
jgi:hypothetical protein